MSKSSSGLEFSKVAEIRGPLLVVDGVDRAAFDELVEIEDNAGNRRLARVLETGFGKAVVQVFEGTSGLSVSGTKARFLGKTMEIPVSDQLLGRVFDGLGRPQDGLPEPVAKEFLEVNGAPINPERREYPTDLIQTGVSVIDGMLTLVRGQKLPIFSGAGMPHNMLAAQIARQATVVGEGEEFAVVFAAVGVSHNDASFFQRTLAESGAIRRSILYLNLADDPAIERIITPRVALTAAEYLAFELGMHVLVIITDITNYCFRRDTEVILGDGTIESIGDYVDRTGFANEGGSEEVLRSMGERVLVSQVPRSAWSGNQTVLSWTSKGLESSRILALEKVRAPNELIHIGTRSGAELFVTHDHKILVDGTQGPELVEAGKLRRGMELYSVREFNLKGAAPTILELLGDREDFFIHMMDNSTETSLAAKYGSLRKACTALNLKYERLSDSFAKRCYTPFELITASSALEITLGTVSEKIEYVTFGKGQRLYLRELQVTPRFTRLLGWVASDGAVYDDNGGSHYVGFTNKNRYLIRRFVKEVEELFPGLNIRIHENQDDVTMVRINSGVLTHLFRKFIQTDTPHDISPVFKLPEPHVAAFLGSYHDGDGSVPRGKKLLQYTTTRRTRAKRLQQLLKRLGIPSVMQQRSSEGTYGPSRAFDVIIRGANSLLKFKSLVPINHPIKKRKLSRSLSALQASKTLKGEEFDLAPYVCAGIFKAVRKRYSVSATELGSSGTISQFENHTRRVARGILAKWLEKLRPFVGGDADFTRLLELVNGNYVLDRINIVEGVGNEDEGFVYDFTVSQTHRIISENGIITSNCEALREISAAREEVPGRKGFPGYLYTDLATNYERAGRIKGKKGSITQMPILSMPSDDVTHPIPDLTGYITEGQVFLGRELFRKGIYPPVYVLSSLSRLMGPALGYVIKQGKARPDHHQVGNQLYNAYARAVELRALAEIVGKSGLTGSDLRYLQFGDEFEQKFLNQGYDENRTFEDTHRIAWETLSVLPESELTNIKEEFIKKNYVAGKTVG